MTELTDRGHRGAVTVISRHGLLPLPDGPVVSYGDFFDPSLARHKIRAVMWRLRAEIAVAAKAGIDWHSVVEAFRIHASQIWIGLADRERRRFLRHLHTLWLAHRHRMPPEQAEIIDAAVVVGRLRIVAGRLRAITAGAGGIKVTFRERGSDQDTLLSVEALINCTGPDWDVARTTSRLVATMIDRGLLRGDEYGLGLDVDESLRARDRQGRPVPGLYVIGPPTRGRFWEVVAVPHLRQQIERILAEWQRRI
ncbi:MAG: hypothetical protein FJX52_04460 [Alphaproteobacteria bacterium]|nr:hypothetical protein [Alphaproteobacteria bacterium]